MKVTDEQVHNGKALPELVDNIKKSDRKTTVFKLFADGAYDGNDVFWVFVGQWNPALHQNKKERKD